MSAVMVVASRRRLNEALGGPLHQTVLKAPVTYCTFDQLDTGCSSVQNSKKQTRSAHSTVVLASSKFIVVGECIKGSLVHIASHRFCSDSDMQNC